MDLRWQQGATSEALPQSGRLAISRSISEFGGRLSDHL
ncbi:hypothetical protein SSYIS1_00710 [Serratia symbiotica]|uniref:Uncharacterized protein n=1 Tax=Serratia symbiotica TaxID=138074 RepID=A0A455VEV2_9GAMM|nr:hypothetical protein SSYIS1_00710 [Serratia symbiotica]